MLRADFTPAFVRDRKRCAKKHWDVGALDEEMEAVAYSDERVIGGEYYDHGLTGDLKGCRALHIGGRKSNWVLLYEIVSDEVFFISTGTHDEVFG